MKPSEICKSKGLKSLKELEDLSGVSKRTLINRAKNNPILFDAHIRLAINKKEAANG